MDKPKLAITEQITEISTDIEVTNQNIIESKNIIGENKARIDEMLNRKESNLKKMEELIKELAAQAQA